jgi:arylsulfatase A-like enzyme
LAGCGGETRPAPRGIVLILLDTTRADHLSVHGYDRDTTPRLERLAQRGTVFEAVQSTSPWTVPTMASLWTGTYPTQHGAGVPADPGAPRQFTGPASLVGFDGSVETLPRRLGGLGYKSYARVSNALLKLDCFTQDFDEALVKRATADQIVDWALERVPSFAEEKFFLYLHFMDVHAPLRAPPDDLMRYLESRVAPRRYDAFAERIKAWDGFDAEETLRSTKRASFAKRRIAAYDGTLHFMDREIGRLLDAFDQAGLTEDTLFVVTSDHGEEMWDHWELQLETYDASSKPKIGVSHGHTMFQELLHVPLFLAGPGIRPGVRLAVPQSQLDLGATILELAGYSRTSAALGDGRSLVPLLEGSTEPIRDELFSEGMCYGYDLEALVDADGYKLVRALNEGERDLLFHLPSDPGETTDLLTEHPEIADRLRRRIEALTTELAGKRFAAGEAATEVDIGDLQDLGYVDTGEDPSGETGHEH